MPEAIKNGTPLPIVLNILDKVIVCGSSNLFGKDCNDKASETVSLRGLVG
jgi:hypothetical protein